MKDRNIKERRRDGTHGGGLKSIKLFQPPLRGALNLVIMKEALTTFLEGSDDFFQKDRTVADRSGRDHRQSMIGKEDRNS